MKIANSAIKMESRHLFTQSYIRKEMVLLGTPFSKDSPNTQKNTPNALAQQLQDGLNVSQKARDTLKQEQAQSAKSVNNNNSYSFELSDEDKLKLQLLESLLNIVSGKNHKFYYLQSQQSSDASLEELKAIINQAQQSLQNIRSQGLQAQVQVSESYREIEQLNFNAGGVVRTTDGQEINFDVQLNMSRTFVQNSNYNYQAGIVVVDPLVINFDGTAAQLTDTKFSFDLNNDGTSDQISFLKPGSGFLALDLNNNQKIDNGSELFGPNSGDGFNDLAVYDKDHNGWIDENDPIFDKLQIWTKDSNGKDQLFALGQKGIGAIFLGNISAQFEMKNQENVSLGQNQQAGIFLKENGGAGTVQQIDLVI